MASKWYGEERKETMRLWMRKERDKRKKEGRCVTCGARSAVKSTVNCQKCLDRGKKKVVENGQTPEGS